MIPDRRRSLALAIPLFLAAFLGVGCGEKAAPVSKPAPTKTATTADGHHGAPVALGRVELGGRGFLVARHGPLEPGKEGAVVVHAEDGGSLADLFVWVADANGKGLSAPAAGDVEGGGLHVHLTPRAGAGAPTALVVRRRTADLDERATLPLHGGLESARDGVVAVLTDAKGAARGALELKLHDDNGDLELWLFNDGAARTPLDFPLDATIRVVFPALGDREITLRVRDAEENHDEDGKTQVRNGRTNYFIFPGETGEDASWLQGTSFAAPVRVEVPVGGETLVSSPFALVPHVHLGDHEH
ncbi:MAG: hypothetical protein R3F20_15625 [Planctomycetota bacterium]